MGTAFWYADATNDVGTLNFFAMAVPAQTNDRLEVMRQLTTLHFTFELAV